MIWHAVKGRAEPCRGALCWASLLPPRLDGTSIELKQRTTAKQNDGPFFLSFASRPFTTEAKNKASLILLVSFRSCSRLTLVRIRWRYFVALFCCRNVKKQRKNRNRICPKLYLPRICVRLSLRLLRVWSEIQWKQKLFEVEFRADSTATFFCFNFCRNVKKTKKESQSNLP